MHSKYYKTIFKSYTNGYYTFAFDSEVEIAFEELHPEILLKYDLKNDKRLINHLFHLAISESESSDKNNGVYRIEYLELINAN